METGMWLVILTGLVASSQAYDFYVGGKDGWVTNPSESFNEWAGRNRFQVNDSLVFRYKKGEDSVLVVKNREAYDKCNTTSPIATYNDGNTRFAFDRSGPFFFISGAAGHCENGQKLVAVVLAVRNGRPPPKFPTPSSPPSISPLSSPPPSSFPSPPSSSVPSPLPTPPSSSGPSPSPSSPSSSGPTPSPSSSGPSPSPSSPSFSGPSPSPSSPSAGPSPSPSPLPSPPSSSVPSASPSPSTTTPSSPSPSATPGAETPGSQTPGSGASPPSPPGSAISPSSNSTQSPSSSTSLVSGLTIGVMAATLLGSFLGPL